MRRLAASFVVLASLTATGLVPAPAQAGPATQAPAPRPIIPDAPVVDAPIGERGGIMTPYTSCSSYRVEPVTRTVMTSLDTRWRRVFEWKGALPAAGFPRVAVGDYKIRTVARCRSTKRVRTELVTVKQKTHRRTMSRAEFNRVQRGMTRAQVAQVVGFGGAAAGSYGGRTLRRYDNMAFWAWSVIEFRRGRVDAKYFDVDHD